MFFVEIFWGEFNQTKGSLGIVASSESIIVTTNGCWIWKNRAIFGWIQPFGWISQTAISGHQDRAMVIWGRKLEEFPHLYLDCCFDKTPTIWNSGQEKDKHILGAQPFYALKKYRGHVFKRNNPTVVWISLSYTWGVSGMWATFWAGRWKSGDSR